MLLLLAILSLCKQMIVREQVFTVHKTTSLGKNPLFVRIIICHMISNFSIYVKNSLPFSLLFNIVQLL